MCGRVRLEDDYSELKIRLKFDLDAPAPNFERDWNIAPTRPMLVAYRSIDGKRVPRMMRWGLLPSWAKEEKLSYATFNARSEEFTTKPAFKDAWRRGQRCLVVTNGFYEWRKSDKQSFAIGMDNDSPMVMAGLWSSWTNPANGEDVLSCTILTCGPNEVMAELHDRMPCILGEGDWPLWLGEEDATEQQLLDMLRPCPDAWIKVWPVDKKVGNVKYNGPELKLPLDDELPLDDND
jgi:putative SOS response-associated peptidase YedK